MSNPAQPLSGLLVVAIEQAVAAPMCTQRLADAGARVIKIERAGGETARHYDRAVHGTSAYFAWLNRGKESAVLDLKNADDLAIVRRMAEQADVLVSNFARGAVDRLGLGFDELKAANPKLIAVQIAGYGGDTPYANARAYDALVQAESGVCAVTGTADTPVKVGVSLADIACGMNAHAAVLEALIARSISGHGRAIEMTLFDTMADWMNVPMMHYEHLGREVPRSGLAHASIYPYGPVECSDGQVMVVVQNPAEWTRFCTVALQRPDLEHDPRFHDNPARDANRAALDGEMAPVFVKLTCEDALVRLEAGNLAGARINTVSGVTNHPAVRRSKASVSGGDFTLAVPPLRPEIEARAVPDIGEHTEAVRQEFGAGP
ncbi:CaiB/BaiF CoA-transferase family protein [Ahrensia sp. R2A130]|uniref:CaiB/BaiF CoA transferase family protein n=1 Tax=Ahrensia sp. R2A130 TaxID=744979 RepID=UPI0001E0ACE5|nr:CaiB/BaiF CoA-transferase family protein [Ahrensia sp. R2A130]EFL87736.1 L-carnitine dehydratase/bile acid-inducible protein F [Ahrensia sp. R2A130]